MHTTVPNAPKTIRKAPFPLVSLDFGNFTLKSFDGVNLTQIRSLQTPLAQGQQMLKSTNESPVIEHNGQRWHVGTQASRYPTTEATVQGDKAQLALLHLKVCIKESGEYHIVVSHHSPQQYEGLLSTALLGHHSYVRNGQHIDATITEVQVIPEGLGAYQLAAQRLCVPRRGYTVLIDLGGSTWLSTLYASDGEVIDHDVHERAGTYALAAAIAKDNRLATPVHQRYAVTSPDPVVIQAGFTQGHFYGDSDLCWGDWLAEYLDPWWKGIVQRLKSRYQQHLPNVKRFVVTGGGSHLISHKVQASPAFLVLPEASTANVVGAYLAAQAT